jgi:hypothetical protein
MLDGAQLQGAMLIEAQLQGAMLDGAQLEGATLMAAMVWRARGRPRVKRAYVAKIDPDTMPWTTANSTFAAWRDAILDSIPGTLRIAILDSIPETLRNAVLVRLSTLDPAAEAKDVIEFWNEASSAPPQGEERENQLTALAALGCRSYGAPHVARGLTRNGLLSTNSQGAVVADKFYKGRSDPTACPGVKGFTDEDWARLSKIDPDPLPFR